jgi:dsRNA-specific ribonuclease
MLQQWSYRVHKAVPRYQIVDAIGPDHRKMFVVEVRLNGAVIGTGDRIPEERSGPKRGKARA